MIIKTKELELRLGNQEVKLNVVSNLEDLLDKISEGEDIPFWAELWPSSLVLAERLSSYAPKGKALEIGAGLGLPGLILAKQGWQVTQTDYMEGALALARENARLNSLEIRQLNGDWRQFPSLGTFDCVIASDVLYEPNLYDYLYQVFLKTTHLGTTLFIADPGRSGAKDFILRFPEEEWQIKKEEKPFSYQGLNYIIDLYEIVRLT